MEEEWKRKMCNLLEDQPCHGQMLVQFQRSGEGQGQITKTSFQCERRWGGLCFVRGTPRITSWKQCDYHAILSQHRTFTQEECEEDRGTPTSRDQRARRSFTKGHFGSSFTTSNHFGWPGAILALQDKPGWHDLDTGTKVFVVKGKEKQKRSYVTPGVKHSEYTPRTTWQLNHETNKWECKENKKKWKLLQEPHADFKDISACGHYFLSRQPNKALEAWSVNSLFRVAALKEV